MAGWDKFVVLIIWTWKFVGQWWKHFYDESIPIYGSLPFQYTDSWHGCHTKYSIFHLVFSKSSFLTNSTQSLLRMALSMTTSMWGRRTQPLNRAWCGQSKLLKVSVCTCSTHYIVASWASNQWPLIYDVWQSLVEIEHYSALVKTELTVLIKSLGLPLFECKCQRYLLLVRGVTPMKMLSPRGVS